jgi:hypothetical protein
VQAQEVQRNSRKFFVSPSSAAASDYWFFEFADPAWQAPTFAAMDQLLAGAVGAFVDFSPGIGAAAFYASTAVSASWVCARAPD